MVHQLVKSTVSTTSVFNSFFRSMDDRFGYGRTNFGPNNNPTTGLFNDRAADWWDKELPIYGLDLKKVL